MVMKLDCQIIQDKAHAVVCTL